MNERKLGLYPGCYVDSARGRYAIDAIVEVAESFGFELPEAAQKYQEQHETLADYELKGELEDRIDDFLSEHAGIPGHYWGRNDNGDYGAWKIDESED